MRVLFALDHPSRSPPTAACRQWRTLASAMAGASTLWRGSWLSGRAGTRTGAHGRTWLLLPTAGTGFFIARICVLRRFCVCFRNCCCEYSFGVVHASRSPRPRYLPMCAGLPTHTRAHKHTRTQVSTYMHICSHRRTCMLANKQATHKHTYEGRHS